MKAVDSHCHLDFEQFDEDREEIIKDAEKQLEFIVVAGSNLEHNKAALELERNYKSVKANLGLHPTYTESFNQLERIKTQIREEDPVAVGEIGLDHHHVEDEEIRERQEEVFREMLELAEELEKPVVVHSRDAEARCVEILDSYDLPGVFLHCFNGEPKLAKEAVEKGMKIGVTTQILYSNRVQNIVDSLNSEDLLLETDSPFLYRGERNQPVNVLESAEKIAEIKETDEETVIEDTTSNSRAIFLR